jgi:hypothetical protein
MADVPQRLRRERLRWTEFSNERPGEEVPREEALFGLDRHGYKLEQMWIDLVSKCAPLQAAQAQVRGLIFSAGFEIEDGNGGRSEFYGKVARTIWRNVSRGGQLLRDLQEAQTMGWRPFELQQSRRQHSRGSIRVDGRAIQAPRFYRAKAPWHFHFDVRRDLIVPADRSPTGADLTLPISEDHDSQRSTLARAKFFVPTYGDSDSPYGESGVRPQYLLATVYRDFLGRLIVGMNRSTGTPTFKLAPGQTIESARESIRRAEAAYAAGKAMIEGDGIAKIDAPTNIDFQKSWTEVLAHIETMVVASYQGSHLSVLQEGQGARAASETHRSGAESKAASDGADIAESYSTGVLVPWLELNGFDPPPEEMPRLVCRLGRKPTVEAVTAFIGWAGTSEGINGVELAETFKIPLVDPESYEFSAKAAPTAAPVAFDDDEEDVEEDVGDEEESKEDDEQEDSVDS